MDANHRQSIIEILAKALGRHLRAQVAMGGGDDAHRDQALSRAAHRPDGTFVERAQEHGLHFHGQLADLVEKQGATVGLDERALAIRDGAGEGPAHVTKERGLDQ